MTGPAEEISSNGAIGVADVDEKSKFPVPDWATKPPSGSHLDVTKQDQLIQKLMIDEKKAYYFGRNPKMVDFAVEHASCSRVHALLLYHSILNRFALVDMGSSHGTFLGKVRLEPLKLVFVEIGTPIQFGASTRRYTLRTRLDSSKGDGDEDDGPKQPVELELENLTEYNTALNRRIPQLPISDDEARRKKRARGNVAFIEEEDIINPEDVDPTVGRFRNMITTAIISNNPNKRPSGDKRSSGEPARKVVRPGRDFSFTAPSSSSLGISLNAAPDLDLYSRSMPKPGAHSHLIGPSPVMAEDDEPHKKKYAKEAWPGRNPGVM